MFQLWILRPLKNTFFLIFGSLRWLFGPTFFIKTLQKSHRRDPKFKKTVFLNFEFQSVSEAPGAIWACFEAVTCDLKESGKKEVERKRYLVATCSREASPCLESECHLGIWRVYVDFSRRKGNQKVTCDCGGFHSRDLCLYSPESDILLCFRASPKLKNWVIFAG